MKELSIDSMKTMTSTQLAEMLGYEVKEINKKVRTMFDDKIGREEISPTMLPNGQVKEYNLPKLESIMFVAKHNDTYLEKITQYWIEQSPTPTNFVQALRLAADKAEALERVEALRLLDKPKVEFADQVVSEADSIQIGTYAKSLSKQHGVKIGGNKLRDFLRESGYLMVGRGDGHERNMPYQHHIASQLFEVKYEKIYNGKLVPVTYITGHGQFTLVPKILAKFKPYG